MKIGRALVSFALNTMVAVAFFVPVIVSCEVGCPTRKLITRCALAAGTNRRESLPDQAGRFNGRNLPTRRGWTPIGSRA